jgi:hypothetical protein
MKYKLIEIRKRKYVCKKNLYEVLSSKMDYERAKSPKPIPNSMGFYYYPDTMSDNEALNELKKVMIKSFKK